MCYFHFYAIYTSLWRSLLLGVSRWGNLNIRSASSSVVARVVTGVVADFYQVPFQKQIFSKMFLSLETFQLIERNYRTFLPFDVCLIRIMALRAD